MRADGSIDGFAALLGKAGLELGAEEMADALWLAGHISPGEREQTIEKEETDGDASELAVREEYLDSKAEEEEELQLPLLLPQKQVVRDASSLAKPDGIPIKVPAAPALRIRLELVRALRPLRRRVPSPIKREFDQAATIERIASQGIWSPVLSPAPERWLEVALVIEESKSAPLWKETLTEFQMLLERQGAFRNVISWRLKSDEVGKLTLLSTKSSRPRSARELLDPTGRRLILVMSDCTSAAWQQGKIYSWLETWGKQTPMTVIQLLPERLWAQTGLAHGVPVWLNALEPGVPSASMLAIAQIPLWNFLESEQNSVTVPVVSLEEIPLKQWAQVVTGMGESQTVGFRFEKREKTKNSSQEPEKQLEPSAEERVRLFRATASLTAQKLAGLMAAAPVNPQIVNLIRQTMLPEAEPVHVAEVYMGGLVETQATGEYDFISEIRDILLKSISVVDTEMVLDRVSQYIAQRIGLNTHSFEALLSVDLDETIFASEIIVPFARVAAQVLSSLGEDYLKLTKPQNSSNKIQQLSANETVTTSNWPPELKNFQFREAIVEFEENEEELVIPKKYGLSPRETEVWKLRQQGLSYREVSLKLGITENTIKKHLKNIFAKINQKEDSVLTKGLTDDEMKIWRLCQVGDSLEDISKELDIETGTVIQTINNIADIQGSDYTLKILIIAEYDSSVHNDSSEDIIQLEQRLEKFRKNLEQDRFNHRSVPRLIDILFQPSFPQLVDQLEGNHYDLLFYTSYGTFKSEKSLLYLLGPSVVEEQSELVGKLLSDCQIKVAIIDTIWNFEDALTSNSSQISNDLAESLKSSDTIPSVIAIPDFLVHEETQIFLKNFIHYLSELQSIQTSFTLASRQISTVQSTWKPNSALQVASTFKDMILIPVSENIQKLLDESQKILKVKEYAISVQSFDNANVWPIHRGSIRIGRLPDNDVVISEPWVSAHHAEIFCRLESFTKNSIPTYFLRDFSRYGTYYHNSDGWQLMHSQEIQLSSGMQLRFGRSDGLLLEFKMDEMSSW